ncbi:PREDICTED: uncharacterized protein LOC104811364 isoform X2 [Tarenaya hassleriana]|uniref:uncharacterized protein LOC104811364 isoform X2 n=1 Tax=Tarenaya hassleriana TaxID=28532 RepID=UPI0008FD1B8C|nr:PREDICTED: uncharacterized protein LOC104811364 isoform X2 [Tarenaya hassleriana]
MGSVCCVAARDGNVTNVHGGGALHRNSARSPTWSFRRDNRRRVADELEGSPFDNTYVDRQGINMDKLSLGSERGALSEGDSPPGHLRTPTSHKSAPPHTELDTNIMIPSPSDLSLTSHGPAEVKNLADSPNIVPSTLPKPSFFTPSLTTSVCDHSSAHSHLLPPKTTPSRQARRSPGHQLFSNDFATGSHYASSEGSWSMNAFHELMASSQRERWSFDNEHLGSSRIKLSGCSSRFSYSPSVDRETCRACARLLTERSSISNYELPIASVLACGHVYHAECLEIMTTEMEKYDPACPICTVGEKQVAKMSKKALKAQAELKAKHYRRYKRRVVDSYVDGESDDFVYQKMGNRDGKALKMDPSSSTIGSLKPFLKWQFGSIGSKLSKPLFKDSASKKKGFWSRHRKE